MKKLLLILVLFSAIACFGREFKGLDYYNRMCYKTYGTVTIGRSLWGDVRVVKSGFADFYVYATKTYHDFGDYIIDITLVDGDAGTDQWHLLSPNSTKEESFSVMFVEYETADFCIRIKNPEKIPQALKPFIKINAN